MNCQSKPFPQERIDAGLLASQPSTVFKTQDDAGVAADSRYNPVSIQEDVEYGGSVCKLKYEASYVFSIPNRGISIGVTESSCPTGTEQNALYHTHGRAHFQGDGELYSLKDRRTANGLFKDIQTAATYVGKAISSYLGTPSGVIKRFHPNTRRDPFEGAGKVFIFKQRTTVP